MKNNMNKNKTPKKPKESKNTIKYIYNIPSNLKF